MDVKATSRYMRLSPGKARDVARTLRGMPVEEALKITRFNRMKAAEYIGKTLKSAISNAQVNDKISVDKLYVKSVRIDEGPSLSRYWARARGGASPVSRRTSHISVVLTDEKVAKKKGK